MKKKIFISLLICLFPILLFAGCSSTQSNTENGNSQWNVIDEVTFVKITDNVKNGVDYGFEIYVHKETKVMYIFYHSHYQCGLSVLLNSDGTPKLWEGEL